jgi:hypothetical protein
MKKFIIMLFLSLILGNIWAIDIESPQFIDHVLELRKPGPPQVFEDGVIFTASSTYQRVGIAFVQENFSKIHWFKKLMIPKENITKADLKNKNELARYRDSGILFYAYTLPPNMNQKELDYRLVIDGLWSLDPLNKATRMDQRSGLMYSTVKLPERNQNWPAEKNTPADLPDHGVCFQYQGQSGQTVSVAGSFNGWDPFMYVMRETVPGTYRLNILLPPGTYQYLFFTRGLGLPDPENPARVYTRNGKPISQIVVK